MSKPRVVITGMGWVTPLGLDLLSVWAGLTQGRSGAGPITHFNAATFPTAFAGQVPEDFDPLPMLNFPELHEGVGRNTSFALGAAAQAWAQAGLHAASGAEPSVDPERLGIYLGSGEGVLDFENYVAANLAGWNAEEQRVDGRPWAEMATKIFQARTEIEQEPNMPLTHLALEFDARGPSSNCLTACAASTQAIGEAVQIIRDGAADVILSGGAHTMIHPLGVTGFNRLTALSNRNDSPTTASRPFSVDRDGFVMGEGAGILVLESLEHAQRRGATPLAEIAGYGSTADAYRITDIHPEGRGAAAAMRAALADAGLTPDAVDYISSHGTGTKENDSIETRAVKSVYGNTPRFGHPDGTVPPMSSIKSMLGHLIAAAGAVEAIACVLAIRDGLLPPTLNLATPDPVCDLDYVPNTTREATVNTCMSNSFGFGGQNDSIVIRRMA